MSGLDRNDALGIAGMHYLGNHGLEISGLAILSSLRQ